MGTLSLQLYKRYREIEMLPTVTRLTNINSYRDGGSIGIIFDGEEQYWCELLFPVNLQKKSDEGGHLDFMKVGYLEPVLEINTPFEWTSKVTGITHVEYKETKQPISWAEARKLLETIKSLVENFEMEGELSEYYDRERGLLIYQEMLDVSRNGGVLK